MNFQKTSFCFDSKCDFFSVLDFTPRTSSSSWPNGRGHSSPVETVSKKKLLMLFDKGLSYITMMTQILRKPYRDVSFAIEIPNENFCIQVEFSNNYYYQSHKNFAITIGQNLFMFIQFFFRYRLNTRLEAAVVVHSL